MCILSNKHLPVSSPWWLILAWVSRGPPGALSLAIPRWSPLLVLSNLRFRISAALVWAICSYGHLSYVSHCSADWQLHWTHFLHTDHRTFRWGLMIHRILAGQKGLLSYNCNYTSICSSSQEDTGYIIPSRKHTNNEYMGATPYIHILHTHTFYLCYYCLQHLKEGSEYKLPLKR